MPVKQITNWAVLGEIQAATKTFIACLTRFRLISHPFDNIHRIPTSLWRLIESPYPFRTYTHGLNDWPASKANVTLVEYILLMLVAMLPALLWKQTPGIYTRRR